MGTARQALAEPPTEGNDHFVVRSIRSPLALLAAVVATSAVGAGAATAAAPNHGNGSTPAVVQVETTPAAQPAVDNGAAPADSTDSARSGEGSEMARLLLVLLGVIAFTVIIPVQLSKRVAARRRERDASESVVQLFAAEKPRGRSSEAP